MNRSFDLLVTLLLIVPVAGLIGLIAAAIWLADGGPVVFRQTRTGLHGQPFTLYKFRTLRTGTGGELDADGKEQQVSANDPRVTPLGRILRRTNFDELLQLLNVLRGEMSWVGPRPHVPSHDEFYAGRIAGYTARYAVRPGITGWAQIHGLTQETPTVAHMARRVALDEWYIAQRCVGLDLKILCLTPWAIVWPLKPAARLTLRQALKKQAIIS